jgi:hypothetical protein
MAIASGALHMQRSHRAGHRFRNQLKNWSALKLEDACFTIFDANDKPIWRDGGSN